MEFEEIVERIKDVLATDGKKSIKDADVARALGIDPNAFYQMKFRNSVPYKEIMDFLASKKISINLFFYNQSSKSNISSERKYKTLRLFKAKASLGGGAWNEDTLSDELIVDKKMTEFFRSDNCDVIETIGDSMEPHIQSGDWCFIDRSDKKMKNGEVWAVNTPDGVVIKECYMQENELILVSFNPAYKPVRLYICECQLVGKFIGLLRKN